MTELTHFSHYCPDRIIKQMSFSLLHFSWAKSSYATQIYIYLYSTKLLLRTLETRLIQNTMDWFQTIQSREGTIQ